MAPRNSPILSILSLVILVVQPYRAFGSSRGNPFGFITDDNSAGMCASAVIVHGYKCHEFEVTTDDGFILSVQRIPKGRDGVGGGANRPPVLLQHGVLVDGITWLQNSPEQSPAMILADNGFDVWISNIRGTRYSRRHVTLDPNSSDYWNWTWDDLVVHDLPTVIDLVFQQTGQKIHYIGHSMGTLIALASFSEGRNLDKIKSAALLSPVAYLSHMTTALGVVAARAFVSEITTIFGLAEFNPRGEPVSNFLKALCAQAGVDCYDLITALTAVRDGVLSKYDYGSNDFNQAHYGEAKPPKYNLTNIPHDLPLFLSYGGQDALSDVQDVETLLDYLKFHDVDKLHVQYIKDFAHADFIIGITAKDIVYNQIIAFFRNQG
ncbi:triacylglycerol lipase 2-like isoform X2 [Nicotiana tabacum]|uniref:Triacylglycerol lipase 2-like isoform X2 n=1 Tax=Nicotiana tabacum TaxID=4097 RepID=A0AC58U8G0_TOBAC